ncbi:MAG: GH3 auxin-responsive promoter family protein [Phenylobacterium sp.]|nr:GH3 auxin-responsive promoter family protein [Phenylobacterium sp.]MCA3750954.1 GH3 auxin-responsive promoter family protein [Phenylobacterium sp.]MCA6241297.1 GH3 auxin-responsive promoter family protein [Phenylobacterium sp.]MCA6276740.1 GH3 auxin-responsive promoter family protein [Phenylobacterium sp.]MCA6284133.1 GH3 auxin-responsive promoter family protein [Phenylobacterium sp.]
MSLRSRLAQFVLAASMETVARRRHADLLKQASYPDKAQSQALEAILRLCKETTQGRRFGVSEALSIDDFRRAVPIQTYEDIRSGIERQIATGMLEVAPEPPLMYARTSGTTGQPKYIPVTRSTLKQFRAAQQAMAFPPHAAYGAFRGRILGFGGPAREEALSNGVPAGSTSGLIYETMPYLLRANYVVPAEVFGIEDYELKYLVTARLALAARDISLIAAANPSTIIRLLSVIEAHRGRLSRDLENGGFHALDRLSPEVFAAVEPLLRPSRASAKILEHAHAASLADLWPNLRAVVTWLGGGCIHAAASVRSQIPKAAGMIDAGYIASELRGTIVVDARNNLALPMLGDVFFEFVENAAWDRGERETQLLHELVQGTEYQIIVTTAAGLLRYQMNDVMRVTGFVGACPTLEFVRKGRGVTNIVGEKLSEDQIHSAVATVFTQPPVFYIALADTKASVYRIFVETPFNETNTAEAFDAKLQQLNIEYAAKRGSGRLASPRLVRLRPGAGAAYHKHCVEVKGQRESQAKVLALQRVEDFDFDFSDYMDANAF